MPGRRNWSIYTSIPLPEWIVTMWGIHRRKEDHSKEARTVIRRGGEEHHKKDGETKEDGATKEPRMQTP